VYRWYKTGQQTRRASLSPRQKAVHDHWTFCQSISSARSEPARAVKKIQNSYFTQNLQFIWKYVYLLCIITKSFCFRKYEKSNEKSVATSTLVVSWQRSRVVRTLVSTGELSLSCARLLAGWVTTLWLSRPLSVSQHGQLSHPSLRGQWISSDPCN